MGVEDEEVECELRADEGLLLAAAGGWAAGSVACRDSARVARIDAAERVVGFAGLDLVVGCFLGDADGEFDPVEMMGSASGVGRVALQHNALPRRVRGDVVRAGRWDGA